MTMKRRISALSIAAMLMPLAGCIPASNNERAYAPPPPPPSHYEASRDYRDEPGYDQALTRNDNVYRGNDGRYYCKRSNGTTGLVVGGVAGGTLGAILGGGGPLGILLGGAAGALLGKSVDKGEVRCR